MCGFSGFYHLSQAYLVDSKQLLQDTVALIQHRGPDDEGLYLDLEAKFACGHRRLATQDLTETGHQPMLSNDERYVLVFNGELYHIDSLRDDLKKLGVQFRGTSDTEVLLNGLIQWGPEILLPQLRGMFAFAFFDRQENRLILGRDPYGIKPLSYAWLDETLWFGSDIRSLNALPNFQKRINQKALDVFLNLHFIPAPMTIFEGVHKLPISSYAIVKNDQMTLYNYAHSVHKNLPLKSVLQDAVKGAMIADVEVGVFLSGGIDSSLVAALAKEASPNRLKSFTIGFTEAEFDESEHAKAVAQYLDLDHHEIKVSAADAMKHLEATLEAFDEPFADVSMIPTFIVSKIAREHVKVVLSGDGGDEAFMGYNRYVWTKGMAGKLMGLPKPLRYILANILGVSEPVLRHIIKVPQLREKLQKFLSTLRTPDDFSMYLSLLAGKSVRKHLIARPDFQAATLSEMLNYFDREIYLPDDILVKSDRASMAHGLEVRVPLLDPTVFEYGQQMSLDDKISGGVGKLPLRQVLAEYLPEHLWQRPKMGFALPIATWLRGEWKDWALAALNDDTHALPISQKEIMAAWQKFIFGDDALAHHIFALICAKKFLARVA